jgi:nitrite reductase (NO-forming)
MATQTPRPPKPVAPLDYRAAEGFADERPPAGAGADKARTEWLYVGLGLTALVAIIAIAFAIFAIADDSEGTPAPAAAPAAPAEQAAPTLAQAKGVAFESFERVDPALPAPVTKVEVDVFHHVTQVHKDLAPTEVWSFAVNGVYHRGTGASAPIVVEEGTTVDFSITNGMSKKMNVNLPHSLDFHSAEVNPGTRYKDIAPGETLSYKFVAKHPGVFMYHCATQPVLMHTGAGMVGAMIVKPKNLAPVDKELWMTQQEFYLGKPGQDADMAKMQAKKPDVIAFNGYADQYKDNPISVDKGEKVRMYVLNAGPSIWSAFHVIGTVFDRTVVEGQVGRHAQTINLAPSQGGWVEFTLDEEGTYPFVTHAFGDMVKGALGVLATPNAPKAAGHGGPAPAHDHATDHGQAAKADVQVELGDMWIKADKPQVKAGKVAFAVKNTGATMHGMAMALQPVEASGGMLDDKALIGKGKELAGGETDLITADLEPGRYELVCFVPGHYAANQKLPFEVVA